MNHHESCWISEPFWKESEQFRKLYQKNPKKGKLESLLLTAALQDTYEPAPPPLGGMTFGAISQVLLLLKVIRRYHRTTSVTRSHKSSNILLHGARRKQHYGTNTNAKG